MKDEINLQASAMHMMLDGAAGAYVAAMGKRYDDHREAIFDYAHAHFDEWMQPTLTAIKRAAFAGIVAANGNYIGEAIHATIVGMAMQAAAAVVGEAPAKEEAKPTDAAVH